MMSNAAALIHTPSIDHFHLRSDKSEESRRSWTFGSVHANLRLILTKGKFFPEFHDVSAWSAEYEYRAVVFHCSGNPEIDSILTLLPSRDTEAFAWKT